MFLKSLFGRSLTCPSGKPLRLSSKTNRRKGLDLRASAAPMVEHAQKGKRDNELCRSANEQTDELENSHGSRKAHSAVFTSKGATVCLLYRSGPQRRRFSQSRSPAAPQPELVPGNPPMDASAPPSPGGRPAGLAGPWSPA